MLYESRIFLPRQDTDSLKGICIFFIMIHHLITLYFVTFDHSVIKFIFGVFAPLACAFFLFMSGYGVYLSFIKENKYCRLLKYMLRIYITFFIWYTIYLLIIHIFQFKVLYNPDWQTTLYRYIVMTMQPHVMWYLKIQVLAYIALFFIMKISFPRIPILVPALIWLWGIAEVLTAILMHKQGAWSASTLAFPLGVTVAVYKDCVFNFFEKFKIQLLISLISLFLILFVGVLVLKLYGVIILSLVTCLLAISLLSVFSFKNSFLIYCGQHSLELYCIHFALIDIFKFQTYFNDIRNIFGFCCIILLSLVLAFVLKKSASLVLGKIKWIN